MNSLIIPIYNGAPYLRATMDELSFFLSTRTGQWNIIFVDDGSTDGTYSQLKELQGAASFPVTVLHYETNKGKGAAVRYGLANTHTDTVYVAYTDVELPYGLAVIEEAVRQLELAGADVCIGKRERGAARQYSWYRKLCTTVFHFFLPRRVHTIQDTQSGCKVFRRAVATDIFSRLHTERWVFDVEVLLVAAHRGYTIQEIPVHIKPSCITPKGGISLLRHGIFIFWDIARIYWYEVRGAYKK